MSHFIDLLIQNYDLSDMINQTVILALIAVMLFNSNIKIRIRRRY